MDLGFDPAMGGAAGLAAALAKFLLFPLARLRRRKGEEDAATGSFYVHPDLQTPAVLTTLALGALAFCLATRTPLFPTLASMTTGLLTAMMGHDATGLARRKKAPEAPEPPT